MSRNALLHCATYKTPNKASQICKLVNKASLICKLVNKANTKITILCIMRARFHSKLEKNSTFLNIRFIKYCAQCLLNIIYKMLLHKTTVL